MKIYNFTGFTGTRHRNIEHHTAGAEARRFLRKVSGGEDVVDISREARRKYEENRTVELEAARIKKLTARVLDIIHNSERRPEIRNTVPARSGMIGEVMNAENMDDDETARLRATAENLLGFFIS